MLVYISQESFQKNIKLTSNLTSKLRLEDAIKESWVNKSATQWKLLKWTYSHSYRLFLQGDWTTNVKSPTTLSCPHPNLSYTIHNRRVSSVRRS